MTFGEHEQLTAELIATLIKADPEFDGAAVHWGPKCRVPGASGFRHQIDVKAKSARWVVLIECKRWNRRIGTPQVLVLAARKIDIAQANPGPTVWAAMVSRRAPTRPAKLLADHFAISIDTVANVEEYAVRLRHQLAVGLLDGGTGSDSATNVLRRPVAEEQPEDASQ